MLGSKSALCVLSLLPLVSCAEVGPGDVSDAAYILELFEQVQQAPLRVAHSGVRRIELSYDQDGVMQNLAYRESVVTDGEGRFSIVPLGALTPVGPVFAELQLDRAGFYFRYRDFNVRDLGTFFENYSVVDLGQPVQVLGRAAWEFEVHTKHLQSPVHYRVTLDLDTGLLLRSVELGESGQVYARLEYESIDLNPDLSGTTYHQLSNQETPASLGPALDALMGFEVKLPTLLPPGYVLSEVSTLVDKLGARWVKLTYTDGVESLFHVRCRSAQPVPGVQVAPGISLGLGDPLVDRVVWMQVGPIVGVQGKLSGLTHLAVGKLPKESLFDLIDSAL